MRRGKVILILSMAALGLVGCSQTKTADVSSISIEKDGTVRHQIIGQFEQNYYETDGLETLAYNRVEEYCADKGKECITLESLEEKDNHIQISLTYSAPEDYSDFNHRELFAGSLEDADKHGYEMEKIAFVSVKGEPVEAGAIEAPEKKQIVIVATKPGEELSVDVYGRVLYINQSADSGVDVSVDGRRSVHIANRCAEDSSGSEAVLSYIVFE